ncbi:hypothetical protein SB778_41040, partial [Paraburkholderia sp. SIMBA_050]
DNRLLFGGGCTYLGGIPADIAAATRPCLERVFPQLAGVRLDYAWGGHIDISMRRTAAATVSGPTCAARSLKSVPAGGRFEPKSGTATM